MIPQLGSSVYHALVPLAAALGNTKAKLWVAGRRAIPGQLQKIQRVRQAGQKLIWMHAASLGEFEQGAPVFAALKAKYPRAYFVLTFFSPSGYEARKDYPLADAVLYLPEDNPRQAKNWVRKLQPDLAIFVKYEFWPYLLTALSTASVPTVLIAGSFRSSQPFFRWYGNAWRKMLKRFTRIIVQTTEDCERLARIGIPAIVGGDPRADRTIAIAEQDFEDPILLNFRGNHKVLLAGSVWPQDVAILRKLALQLPEDWRMVLAPHQLKEEELATWAEQLNAQRYTRINREGITNGPPASVMIMDTIGILSKAYRYADLTYIGGGFGAGIHNTLEPMAYGLPVIFGPKIHKFPEAGITLARGGSFVVKNENELISVFKKLLDPEAKQQARSVISDFIQTAKGATTRTLNALPDL